MLCSHVRANGAYLDDDVPIETVDRHIRTLGVDVQVPRKVSPQSVQVTFGLLDLGLLLGTTGFGDEVNGELIGGSATNEVGEIGGLQVCSGRRGSASRRAVLSKGLGLALQLHQERATLMRRDIGAGDETLEGSGGVLWMMTSQYLFECVFFQCAFVIVFFFFSESTAR